MPIEVLDLYTGNTSGEPVHAFFGGDTIAFFLRFRIWDVPPNTRTGIGFIMRQLGEVWTDDGDITFTPRHWLRNTFELGPGTQTAWVSWTLPPTNPFPDRPLPRSEWARFLFEHWRTRD